MEAMCNGYKKLEKIEQDDPAIAKEYMERKSIADSRLIFRLRTEMVNLKDNMKNMYNLSTARHAIWVLLSPRLM